MTDDSPQRKLPSRTLSSGSSSRRKPPDRTSSSDSVRRKPPGRTSSREGVRRSSSSSMADFHRSTPRRTSSSDTVQSMADYIDILDRQQQVQAVCDMEQLMLAARRANAERA